MYGTYDPYSMYNQYHDMTDQENELIDVLTSCIIHSLYITHLSIYVGTPYRGIGGVPHPPPTNIFILFHLTNQYHIGIGILWSSSGVPHTPTIMYMITRPKKDTD